MNLARRTIGCLAAGWLASVCLVLTAGCASSSSQRVYDRYAQLVAQRNQSGVASAPTTRSTAKPTEPAPVRKPAAPAAAAKAPAPAARPSAPHAAAPVQVLAPKPAEHKPAPVPPAPAPAPVSVPASVPPSVPAVDNPTAADLGYRLKVGDGIQIYLRGIPGAEVIEDIIDERGMVTLPLINEVQSAGLTASELERNVRQIYQDQDIYRNITVNVVVPTRFYFIQGEVRAPGRFQIMSATRVSQAIAASGGYTEYASGKVLVKRQGKIVKEIRNARRLERAPEDDLLLEPDDVIEVLRSWF